MVYHLLQRCPDEAALLAMTPEQLGAVLLSILKEIAQKEGLKNVPLTVFDGIAGPEDYKIAEKADITVMMWVDSDVKVNYAFAKGELKAGSTKSIIADTKKILD